MLSVNKGNLYSYRDMQESRRNNVSFEAKYLTPALKKQLMDNLFVLGQENTKDILHLNLKSAIRTLPTIKSEEDNAAKLANKGFRKLGRILDKTPEINVESAIKKSFGIDEGKDIDIKTVFYRIVKNLTDNDRYENFVGRMTRKFFSKPVAKAKKASVKEVQPQPVDLTPQKAAKLKRKAEAANQQQKEKIALQKELDRITEQIRTLEQEKSSNIQELHGCGEAKSHASLMADLAEMNRIFTSGDKNLIREFYAKLDARNANVVSKNSLGEDINLLGELKNAEEMKKHIKSPFVKPEMTRKGYLANIRYIAGTYAKKGYEEEARTTKLGQIRTLRLDITNLNRKFPNIQIINKKIEQVKRFLNPETFNGNDIKNLRELSYLPPAEQKLLHDSRNLLEKLEERNRNLTQYVGYIGKEHGKFQFIKFDYESDIASHMSRKPVASNFVKSGNFIRSYKNWEVKLKQLEREQAKAIEYSKNKVIIDNLHQKITVLEDSRTRAPHSEEKEVLLANQEERIKYLNDATVAQINDSDKSWLKKIANSLFGSLKKQAKPEEITGKDLLQSRLKELEQQKENLISANREVREIEMKVATLAAKKQSIDSRNKEIKFSIDALQNQRAKIEKRLQA